MIRSTALGVSAATAAARRWRPPPRARVALLDGARLAIDATTGALGWSVARFLADPSSPTVAGWLTGVAACAAAVGGLLPDVRRARWRYFSFADLGGLLRGTVTAAILMTATLALLWLNGTLPALPVKSAVLFPLLLASGLAATRVLRRGICGSIRSQEAKRGAAHRTVLLAGALQHTVPMARLLAEGPQRPVALFDPAATGRYRAQRIPIFSRVEDLDQQDLLGSLDMIYLVEIGEDRRSYAPLVHRASEKGTRIRVVSAVGDPALQDSPDVRQPLRVPGLLNRPRRVVELASLQSAYAGKRILVTGAAGSIGSEICRQLATLGPHKLLLLDLSENDLCYLLDELADSPAGKSIEGVIGDVRNRILIDRILERLVPDVVFHAAARKHVNLMEYQPDEAVRMNVGGTMTLADACRAHGVERFVFVSTDKAVHPTSVMGATKSLGELYLRHLAAGRSATRFVSVRLGNVLGSSGSVLQLFQRQIARGKPLTITEPSATRYFIDICEAVHLILRAGAIGESGQVLMLDMGRPVRVLDLAENLAMAHGMDPELLPFKVIGLRPGERLHEELWSDGERLRPTGQAGLFAVESRTSLGPEQVRMLQELRAAASAGDDQLVSRLLVEITPGYQPGTLRGGRTTRPRELPEAIVAEGRLAA